MSKGGGGNFTALKLAGVEIDIHRSAELLELAARLSNEQLQVKCIRCLK